MRTEMFTKFGQISPKVHPAALRYFYRSLTCTHTCLCITLSILINQRGILERRNGERFWYSCRQDTATHLAKAVLIRDFRHQVKSRLPKDTPVPGEVQIRLQFRPKSNRTRTCLRLNNGRAYSTMLELFFDMTFTRR